MIVTTVSGGMGTCDVQFTYEREEVAHMATNGDIYNDVDVFTETDVWVNENAFDDTEGPPSQNHNLNHAPFF